MIARTQSGSWIDDAANFVVQSGGGACADPTDHLQSNPDFRRVTADDLPG